MTARRSFLAALCWLLATVAPAMQGQPASSLKEQWRVPGRVRGTPALTATTAYVLARNHAVYAVDRSSGKLLWEAGTGETGDATLGTRVAVTGNTVIAGDYNVVGFDRESGSLRWRFQPADGYGAGIYIGTVLNGTVYTGSPAGRLYAIHGSSGALKWSSTVWGDKVATLFEPVTDGTLLVAGYTIFEPPTNGGVVAVDATNGKELWRRSFPASDDPFRFTNYAGGMILLEDTVVASSGDGSIHGLDRRTGAVLWSIPTLEGPFTGIIKTSERDYRPLASANGVLIAGSVTGYIAAYDLATRKERWRHDGGHDGSTAFQLSHDARRVYAPYASGMVVALDIETGREVWRVGDFTIGFIWPPAVEGDTIYLAGSHAGLHAFENR
jgi:outer membrane protein assembly factor BamB